MHVCTYMYVCHRLRLWTDLLARAPPHQEASVDHLLEPLLVFCNGRSGGNQGVQLLLAFKRHLNPYQVFDLANGGPYPG